MIVWCSTSFRRLLEHKAACAGVDLSTYTETILRNAVAPPRRSRRAHGHLQLLNNETPASRTKEAAGARGSDGRTQVES